jgi:hypothetical protein
MGSNYNAFSPNCSLGSCSYADEFTIVAGDALFELQATLCTIGCDPMKNTCNAAEQGTEPLKEPLDLTGYSEINLYVRYICIPDLIGQLRGAPVLPLENGEVIFLFPEEFFNGIVGEVEGEIEIVYQNGRIVTSIDKVKFNVISDFSGS